jgi:hypothetical protein
VEEALSGGNTHDAIVRVDDTVRRPIGPWTPGVHALLDHLKRAGFDGAPRVRGIDEQGREVLDYIAGDVVHPDHDELLAPDSALAEVAAMIRRFHDAVESFPAAERFAWSDRGADPSGADEILCHNDLAPWNLVRADGGWAFIDWDLAAPGRRSWDLAWALLSMVPLMPGSETRVDRIALFREAYGPDTFPADILDVAVERCEREADLITRLGATGEGAVRAPPAGGARRDLAFRSRAHRRSRADLALGARLVTARTEEQAPPMGWGRRSLWLGCVVAAAGAGFLFWPTSPPKQPRPPAAAGPTGLTRPGYTSALQHVDLRRNRRTLRNEAAAKRDRGDAPRARARAAREPAGADEDHDGGRLCARRLGGRHVESASPCRACPRIRESAQAARLVVRRPFLGGETDRRPDDA